MQKTNWKNTKDFVYVKEYADSYLYAARNDLFAHKTKKSTDIKQSINNICP